MNTKLLPEQEVTRLIDRHIQAHNLLTTIAFYRHGSEPLLAGAIEAQQKLAMLYPNEVPQTNIADEHPNDY